MAEEKEVNLKAKKFEMAEEKGVNLKAKKFEMAEDKRVNLKAQKFEAYTQANKMDFFVKNEMKIYIFISANRFLLLYSF